jgi:fucose permease
MVCFSAMSSKVLIIVVSLIFAALGLNISVLGPALEDLVLRTGEPIEAFGFLFTAVSIGYLLSAPFVALLGKRLSMRMLLAAPVIIIAGQSIIATASNARYVLIGAFLLGFGQSLTQVAYTTLLGDHFHGLPDSDAIINRANAFYGVGALTGPIIAAASYQITGGASFAFAAAIALSAMILVVGLLIPLPQAAQSQHGEADASRRALFASPLLMLLAATMAVYVGVEVAFSGWTTEFTKRILSIDVARASFASSLFFAGLALSRYFANILLRYASPERLIAGMLIVAVGGLLMMLITDGSLMLALIGSGLVGVGLGPVYPTIVSIGMRQFPAAARLASSLLTSSGSFGSITIPPVIGGYIAVNATLASAWLLLAALCTLTLILWIICGICMQRTRLSAGQ